MATDKRISKVRGTTTMGAIAETKPVDGFWFLTHLTTDPNEQWSLVEALSSNGKVLYRIEKPPKPRQTSP